MVAHAWEASGFLRVPGQTELCSKTLLRETRDRDRQDRTQTQVER